MKIIRNSEKGWGLILFCRGNPTVYEGIFGHVTAFWIFTHVKIVLIVTAASILITNQHLFASS